MKKKILNQIGFITLASLVGVVNLNAQDTKSKNDSIKTVKQKLAKRPTLC